MKSFVFCGIRQLSRSGRVEVDLPPTGLAFAKYWRVEMRTSPYHYSHDHVVVEQSVDYLFLISLRSLVFRGL